MYPFLWHFVSIVLAIVCAHRVPTVGSVICRIAILLKYITCCTKLLKVVMSEQNDNGGNGNIFNSLYEVSLQLTSI